MGEDNLGIELINKDATINALIPILAELSVNPYTQGRIIGCILNQPKAYDVEKVVAELEKFQKEAMSCAVKWAYEKSINAVKRGGVE